MCRCIAVCPKPNKDNNQLHFPGANSLVVSLAQVELDKAVMGCLEIEQSILSLGVLLHLIYNGSFYIFLPFH